MAYEFGTKFGFVPGSQVAGSRIYGPQYQGVYGAMNPPDSLKAAQAAQLQNQTALDTQKFDMMKGLWGQLSKNLGSSGSINASSYGGMIPAPNYMTPGPIWNQGQINSQANQQRAQMQAQAANATRGYATSAAARGFSPMSPLTQFMQQTMGQRANIGAAQNETKLNWDAALGNAQNMNQQSGINAGLYGSYTDALAKNRSLDLQAQNQQWGQQNEMINLLSKLLGSV